uniref:Transposase (putative) gypsy type domain-containing protein n=1 Tax=Tanacetum cinerariifolium TaxID=118510 RepID=A0A6L2MN83_TANCI|nr:hypothetical protein [Tanacetum cinerariifolium]
MGMLGEVCGIDLVRCRCKGWCLGTKGVQGNFGGKIGYWSVRLGARLKADEELTQRLQAKERDKYTNVDQVKILVDLINQRKRYFAAKRAKERRNKPMTQAQQRTYMSNYIKYMGSYTLKQLKKMSFNEIKELFEATMRNINDFVPMESEDDKVVPKLAEARSLKRDAEEELEHEESEKQKTSEASGSAQEQPGMNVEPLQTKYSIIDWEIYTEYTRKYWKIIKVGNHTEVYQFFEDMLKIFNKDDLVMLWSLVKERFSSTKPTDDKEKVLWVELKRLFEHDTEDELWELHKYMHDPLTWRLYDTCGVYHVFIEKGMDIFMLIEKEYPLSKGLMTVMLVNKLLVDQHSEMANEPSELSQLVVDYDIPQNVRVMLLKRNQTIFDAPLGYVRLYTHFFTLSNLRIPLPKFICEVLNYFKVHISHFNPFELAKLTTFATMCKVYGEMDFRSFMIERIDGEFHFSSEGDDALSNKDEVILIDCSITDKAKNHKVGTSSKVAGKRKQTTTKSSGIETRQKTHKVPPQESKASGDPSDPLDVDSDPDNHGKFITPHVSCFEASVTYDVIWEREKEKDKARVNKLHGEYSRLVLEEKKWINYDQNLATLYSKVEGLENKRERLRKSETQLFDKIGLLVARLVKTALVHGRCLAFEEVAARKDPFKLEKMFGYRPLLKREFDLACDNLATASYPFLAKAIADPYAPLEVLLSKKPKSLHAKPALSQSKSKPLPLTWMVTSWESTKREKYLIFMFTAILRPSNNDLYFASLLVVLNSNLKAYVYSFPSGLTSIRLTIEPAELDASLVHSFYMASAFGSSFAALRTSLLLSVKAARYITKTSPLIGANGSDLLAPFERNLLRDANFPLRLCISLSVFCGFRLIIALTFEGLALIPCLVMRCPKNGPSSTPKEHLLGLSFMLMDWSLSKISWMSINMSSSEALLITISST